MKKFLVVFLCFLMSFFLSMDRRVFHKNLSNDVFRVDFVGINNKTSMTVSADVANTSVQTWCKDCVTSSGSFSNIKQKATWSVHAMKNNKMTIKLRGPDVKLDNKRVPVYVVYKNLVVNGDVVLNDPVIASHDKPYKYTLDVKAGQKIEVSVIPGKADVLNYWQTLHVNWLNLVLYFSFLISVCAIFLRFSKNKSKIDSFFVFLFGILLFIPMLHISDAEKSVQENRVLATKPSLMVDNNINEKYGNQFNDYFNDRFFCRNILIQIYDFISYSLSNIYQNDKALFVKDNGWMFEKNKFPSPKNTKIIVDNLKKFDDFCKSHNMKLYVILVPEKEMIYQDVLAKSGFFNKKKADAFKEYMNKITNILPDNRIIYPYKELLNAKNQDYVFFKQSHHWTDWGAYIGYKLLAKRIKDDFNKFNIVTLDDYNKTFSKKIRDDWERNYHLGYTTYLLNLKNKANDILDTEYTYYDNKKSNYVSENRQRYIKLFDNKNRNAKYKLFLTGNSQNEDLLQYLPYSVKSLMFLRLNKEQQSSKNEKKFMKYYKKELLDYKPDIVVICVSSVYFYGLMNDFYKD